MGAMEGAERTVWGTLLEMDRFNYYDGEKDQGAVALSWTWRKPSRESMFQWCGHVATHF